MVNSLFKSYLTVPWKKKYVLNKKKNKECIFCSIARKSPEIESWEVFRDEMVMVLLNRFPYNPGHLLIVPLDHWEEFDEMPTDLTNHITLMIKRGMRLLRKTHNASSFNIGLNQGFVSGASIAHLHWHIVPRYPTDLNFIDILGTRALIETLSETLQKMKENKKILEGEEKG